MGKSNRRPPAKGRLSAHARGHFAERAAALLLLLKGYRPIARNAVVGRGTGAGEIDLIVKRGKTLVFVEVKKRATLRQAHEAITQENQIRVIRGSAAFLAKHPEYGGCGARYDAVLMAPRRWPVHIVNAWRVL